MKKTITIISLFVTLNCVKSQETARVRIDTIKSDLLISYINGSAFSIRGFVINEVYVDLSTWPRFERSVTVGYLDGEKKKFNKSVIIWFHKPSNP